MALPASTCAMFRCPPTAEQVDVSGHGRSDVSVLCPRLGARRPSAERFRELIANAPRPDEKFADDLREIRESAGAPGEPWPS